MRMHTYLMRVFHLICFSIFLSFNFIVVAGSTGNALPQKQCSSFPPREKIERCMKLIESGVLKASSLAEAHSEIAQAYLDRCSRDHMLPCVDAGIRHLNFAIQAKSDDWMTHKWKSDFWSMRAYIDSSEASLLRAVVDLTHALEHLRQTIDRMSGQALKYMETASLKTPFRFSGMHNEYADRGDLYVRLCRFTEATADFEMAIRLAQMGQKFSKDADELVARVREYESKLEKSRADTYSDRRCSFSDRN